MTQLGSVNKMDSHTSSRWTLLKSLDFPALRSPHRCLAWGPVKPPCVFWSWPCVYEWYVDHSNYNNYPECHNHTHPMTWPRSPSRNSPLLEVAKEKARQVCKIPLMCVFPPPRGPLAPHAEATITTCALNSHFLTAWFCGHLLMCSITLLPIVWISAGGGLP